MWVTNNKTWYSESEYLKLQNRIKLLKKIMTDNIRNYRNKISILQATVQNQNLVKIVEENQKLKEDYDTLLDTYNACVREHERVVKQNNELQGYIQKLETSLNVYGD